MGLKGGKERKLGWYVSVEVGMLCLFKGFGFSVIFFPCVASWYLVGFYYCDIPWVLWQMDE